MSTVTVTPSADSPAASGISASVTCGHCGQLVIGSRVPGDQGESFCCEGCRAVHMWLNASRLESYYDLLEQSGKRAPQAFPGGEFQSFLASLDQPGVLAGVGRWQDSRHALTLACGEISCAGCGWLLERLLQGAQGVRTFDVDFIHGEAFLEYDSSQTSLKDILSVPAGFGYRLRPKRDDFSAKHVPDRALLYRLAVSGACFANAMAFSLAVYLGAFKGMPRAWVDAFGILGALISLPAVAYAANPFFSGAWNALKAKRFNIDVTVSIGILLSSALTVSSLVGKADTNFSDSLTGLIFFLLLGRWTVRRFEAGLALKGRWFDALSPGKVRIRRPEGTETADAGDVRQGEVLELLGGEYAPMDGILESDEAWMDTSLLTGESRAARLRFGDAVFAGYLNVRGRAWIKTHGTTGTTRIAGLGRELDALVAGRRSLPDGVGRVAKWFTLAVIACGLAALAMHWSGGGAKALAAAASVFIISCSCALALAAPISRGVGLKRALTLGFHFRGQSSLEALQGIRCVLFDKTGTLTFMRRTVSQWSWIHRDGGTFGLAKDGTGGLVEAAFDEMEILRSIKALAKRSLHPVALSLFRALEPVADAEPRTLQSREIAHFGLVGRFTGPGPAEICICRYGACEEKDGEFMRLGYAVPGPEALARAAEGNGEGAACDSCVFVDGRLAALIRFTDEIKPDAGELVSGLAALGVTAVLLSGDNAAKVEAFAQFCGFAHYHSALTPEDKGRLARGYRDRFGPCLAVGDGFNDNLLFGASDLAMAVHGGAVDLSKGTDILFTGSRPSDLTRLFVLGSRVRRSISISFWISGAYNAFAIFFAMRGGISPLSAALLMPLSSLSLCLVALLTIRPGPAPFRRIR
jgi:Cu2+-exporting ATPase